MGNSLQFTDCPHCGKRVRSEASKCHHCHSDLSVAPGERTRVGKKPSRLDAHEKNESFDHNSDEGCDSDQSHYAVGGYDTKNDDFDYEEFVAEEFSNPRQKPRDVKAWIWVTAWVLIAATLLPFLFYFIVQ